MEGREEGGYYIGLNLSSDTNPENAQSIQHLQSFVRQVLWSGMREERGRRRGILKDFHMYPSQYVCKGKILNFGLFKSKTE